MARSDRACVNNHHRRLHRDTSDRVMTTEDEGQISGTVILSPEILTAAAEIWAASRKLAQTYRAYDQACTGMRAAIDAAIAAGIPREDIMALATRGNYHVAEDALSQMIRDTQ
jgi:hypothetical protein